MSFGEAQMAESIIRVGLTDAWKVTVAPNVNTCTVNTDVYLLRLRLI